MIKIRKKINHSIPFIRILPNFITLLGLVIGMSAIQFGLDKRWKKAVCCIIISAIIDGIDGRIARLLKVTSPFGAELDSLCDFANFGIIPAFVMYLWSFYHFQYNIVLSYGSMILFMVCMVLRLARFNANFTKMKSNVKKNGYFLIGVPAPCGALLVLLPLILEFKISNILKFNIRSYNKLINIYIIIVAFLVVSKLPTLSTYNFHIKYEYLSLLMIAFVINIILLIIYPWYLLPLFILIYILSIPICYSINKNYKSLNKK